MTDSADESLPLSAVTRSLDKLLDTYESRQILGSQTTELDILSWSNGMEVLLKDLVLHVSKLTAYVASRDLDT